MMEKEIDLASQLFKNDGDNTNKKSSRSSKWHAEFKDGGEGLSVSSEHQSAFSLPSKKRLRKQVGTVLTSLPIEPSSLKVTLKKSSGPISSEGGKKKGIVVVL